MTVSELSLSTNTARQVNHVLTNSEVQVRGMRDQFFDARGFIQPGYLNCVLFPAEGALDLSDFAYPQRADLLGSEKTPVNLIVPDGTWSQAKKIVVREKVWAELPRVVLPPGPPTEYGLRETRHPEGVCTFEAVARALGILEGPSIQEQMEAYFRVRTLRALWARGVVKAADVPGGIPEAARKEGARRK